MNKKRFKYEYGLIWNENGEEFDVNECEGRRLVCDKLNEQQATIRKLQDLCGQSDSENAKLRIENKKLKAKLREKEEDEKLYANEILELRETNKEHIKFKSLGGNY